MIADATGSEWDWMQFFWKMNTASTDAWSMAELMKAWAGDSSASPAIPPTAETSGCCHNTTTPPLCSFTVTQAQCDASPSWTWIEFGQKWDDVWTTAQNVGTYLGFSQDKRNRFVSEAQAAKIDY